MGKRLLGIDHGLVRIGIAAGDTGSFLARELAVIKRQSKRQDFERIGQMMKQQRAEGFVIGLPLNLEHEEAHSQADTVRIWAEALRATLPYPIVFWDEQLSSHDAMALAKARKRRAREPIDDLAARVILQDYLEAVREKRVQLPDEWME